jgi:predicted MFS family arabinose efflux permease
MQRAGDARHNRDRRTEVSALRATLAGFCATLVGIGLARFAYTPLIPALIAADWFTPGQAAYLGAANLAGYLVGALLARRMAAHVPTAAVLRTMMAAATVAFFACAAPLAFSWFFLWRFGAGVAGGALMVLAASTVLEHVPPSRRGLAGGAIFTGVGAGIAASGTFVPLLLHAGLSATWCGLGALALVLSVLAWGAWPAERIATIAVSGAARERRPRSRLALNALYAEYALCAAGLVPHMVFLVDFVARDLGRGIAVGSYYWILFGIGAVTGPMVTGYLADRIGFARALRLALALQAVAVGLPAIAVGFVWLAASSLVVGAMVPGVVPLVLGRVHELAPRNEPSRRAAWSFATAAFALGQAAAAYGFSFLFARSDGGYAMLFGLGAALLALALGIDFVAAVLGNSERRSRR